jgi:hypothetical protein
MTTAPTTDEIAALAAHALFSKKLLTNVHRAVVVEAIVSTALGDDWTWCSEDYASCDFRHNDGTRLEIKQSASLQSWNAATLTPSVCQFDVAERDGEWKGSVWTEGKARNADVYLLCHHPIISLDADHRDARQWRFFAINENTLPKQGSIRLSVLERTYQAVSYNELRDAVEARREERVP